MNADKNNTQLPQSSVSGSVMASELRIGNLLLFEDEQIIVSGLNKYFIYWEKSNFAPSLLNCFKPIPLSEELLYKIGAIKLDFKDFPSFNLFGTQINFVNGLWIEYVSRVEIKGLHHLQNIFFFRNSEELQVGCLTDR